MSFFVIVKIFLLFFWDRDFFKSFFLEAFSFFSECRVGFSIYFVGISLPLFFLKVVRFIISLVFLGLFFKVIVEARSYRD
jgi:hypothetical protein